MIFWEGILYFHLHLAQRFGPIPIPTYRWQPTANDSPSLSVWLVVLLLLLMVPINGRPPPPPAPTTTTEYAFIGQ